MVTTNVDTTRSGNKELNEYGLAIGLDEVLDGLEAASRKAAVNQLKAKNLLGFQSELVRKMENAEADYDALIGFEAGGVHFLVSAMDVAGIYDIPQITPVPVAESWMAGVANVAGEVCTITNLGDFIKKTPVNLLSPGAKLIVPRSDGKAALAIDKVTYLTPRNMLKVSNKKQNIESKGWFLSSYANDSGISMVELDINALLASEEFLAAWISSTGNS